MGKLLVGVALGVGVVAASAAAAPAVEHEHRRAEVAAHLRAPAQVGDDGLELDGVATYTVDLPARVIRVAVDLTATNLIAPEVGSTVIRYTYFEALAVPVLAEAANLAATTDAGRPLTVEVEREGGDLLGAAVISLASRLDHRETQRVRLTYELPDQGPRSPAVTRVNPAYASVVSFAVGDPGRATVRVVVPADARTEILGLDVLLPEPGTDPVVFSATAIEDPLGWDATMVVRRPEAFERRTVPLAGGDDVDVLSWPGDLLWSDLVASTVEEGQPLLVELIGQPWPADGTVTIEQAFSMYLYGYGGWFDVEADRIEIGDELEPVVVLHELAHAWFNVDLFEDRWVSEGFAEEAAARALEELDLEVAGPQPIDPAAPGAIPLADWSTPALSIDISDEQEDYGYNASYFVISSLYDEVGVEAMAEVIDAAANDLIAYRGDPEPETDSLPTDWTRLLDLLEEVAGSETARELFATHVVPPSRHALLEERDDARVELAELVEAGDGWTAPSIVRRHMARWTFDEAVASMSEAREILEVRDELADVASSLELGLPAGFEEEYETSNQLTPTRDRADELLAAGERLVEVAGEVGGDHDLFSRIGMIGGAADDAVDDAAAAFEAGDVEGVAEETDQALAAVDAAGDIGKAVVAGVVVALVLAGLVLRFGVGRRRRRSAAATATLDVEASPTDAEASPISLQGD